MKGRAGIDSVSIDVSNTAFVHPRTGRVLVAQRRNSGVWGFIGGTRQLEPDAVKVADYEAHEELVALPPIHATCYRHLKHEFVLRQPKKKKLHPFVGVEKPDISLNTYLALLPLNYVPQLAPNEEDLRQLDFVGLDTDEDVTDFDRRLYHPEVRSILRTLFSARRDHGSVLALRGMRVILKAIFCTPQRNILLVRDASCSGKMFGLPTQEKPYSDSIARTLSSLTTHIANLAGVSSLAETYYSPILSVQGVSTYVSDPVWILYYAVYHAGISQMIYEKLSSRVLDYSQFSVGGHCKARSLKWPEHITAAHKHEIRKVLDYLDFPRLNSYQPINMQQIPHDGDICSERFTPRFY